MKGAVLTAPFSLSKNLKINRKIKIVGVDSYIDPQTNNVINGLMWASAPTLDKEFIRFF